MLAVCRELKTSKRTSSVRHLASMDGRPKHAPRCRSLGVYDGCRTLNARPAGFHVNRAPNLTLDCMPCTVRDAATRADVGRAVPPRTCTSRRPWLHVPCLLAVVVVVYTICRVDLVQTIGSLTPFEFDKKQAGSVACDADLVASSTPRPSHVGLRPPDLSTGKLTRFGMMC